MHPGHTSRTRKLWFVDDWSPVTVQLVTLRVKMLQPPGTCEGSTCQGTEYIEKQKEQLRKHIAGAVLVLYYEKIWYSLSNIPLICKSMRMYMSNILACVEQTPRVRREIHAILKNHRCIHCVNIWVFPKIRVPQNGWFIIYNGKPHQNGWFGGTTIFGNIHIWTYSITQFRWSNQLHRMLHLDWLAMSTYQNHLYMYHCYHVSENISQI